MATFGQFYEMGPYFSGGNMAAGLKIYHYTAGTNTLLNVYTGRDKATAAAQPVVCDSQGVASFYGDGIYKLVVATAANTADPPNDVLYTFDNVNLTDGSQSLVGKGANISSASTLILGTDGDEFVVTGAVTIALISGTQTTVKLVFASALTLTYSGNLLLAGGVSATTAANDVYYFANEGLSGGNYIWREVSRATFGTTGSMIFIETKTASASATIDFTTGIASTYNEYIIVITNLVNATSGSDLYLRVSQDGGSTFKAGASDYSHARWSWDAGAGSSASGSTGATNYLVAASIRNTALTDALSGEIRCFVPAGTALNKFFTGSMTYISTTPALAGYSSVGSFILNQAAYNGIRLLMSAGNITSGTFTLYGIRKA